MVFQKRSQVAKAIKEFQGHELAGEKLMLETLVSVPAEVKEGDLIEEEEEPKEKDKKKLIENDQSKKAKRKVEDDDDEEDDEEEMMEFEGLLGS